MTSNMLNGDETGKIFVGGLSWETDKDSLSKYFSHYGEVVDCVVMKDNATGKSRGFGFVKFKDPSIVDDVLQNTHTLDGRTIDPKPCNPRSVQLKKKGSNFKIFLGGLPLDITESDLNNFFSNYGNVTEVTIMYDQGVRKCRGFGFLSFDNEDAVERACKDRFVHIRGKQVECKLAQVKQPNSGFGMMPNSQNMYPSSANWNVSGQMSNNGMGNNYANWGNQSSSAGYQGNGYQNWNGGYSVQPAQYGGAQSYGQPNNINIANYGYGGNYMQQPPQTGSQNSQGYAASGPGNPQDMAQKQLAGPGDYYAQTAGQTNGSNQEAGRGAQTQGYHPYRR